MPFMRKLCMALVACAASFASSPASAGGVSAEPCRKPLKVLMIGNSFSVCVLEEMPAVCKDLGLELDLCSLYIGGCPLSLHASNLVENVKLYDVKWNYRGRRDRGAVPFGNVVDGAKKGRVNLLRGMIAGDRWDVVTIQQASHESWRPGTYEPYGSQLIAAIRELAPQAKIYVQQTWSYTPAAPRFRQWGLDWRTMYEKLDAAYAAFAARHGLEMIRTGEAVQRFRAERPAALKPGVPCADDVIGDCIVVVKKGGRRTVKGDTIHLNKRGHYLQALVWTAKLFGADVSKSEYLPKSMKERDAEAALMRRIASSLRKMR